MIELKKQLNNLDNSGKTFLEHDDFVALLNTLEAHEILNKMECLIMGDNENYFRLKLSTLKKTKEERIDNLDFDILFNKKRPSVAFQITNWREEENLSATTMYYFEQKDDVLISLTPKSEIVDNRCCLENDDYKTLIKQKI